MTAPTLMHYILRYRKITQKNKEYYQIIFDRTPFYGEMGGQVGDRGVMKYLDGETIDIFDTKRERALQCISPRGTDHFQRTIYNQLSDLLSTKKPVRPRHATIPQPTCCHEALREVLGSHVEQRGSYVSPKVLRFDFSPLPETHPPRKSRKSRNFANKAVRRAIPRDEHRCVPIDKAREMGSDGPFGEKYGDEVRESLWVIYRTLWWHTRREYRQYRNVIKNHLRKQHRRRHTPYRGNHRRTR